jgi:hypothetical protein
MAAALDDRRVVAGAQRRGHRRGPRPAGRGELVVERGRHGVGLDGEDAVAVEANRVPADFSDAFTDTCQAHGATVTATIEADGHTHEVTGRGHPDFSFENERSHVIRTSDYVDDRTVMVSAEKAAGDLDRGLVEALAAGADLRVVLRVE